MEPMLKVTDLAVSYGHVEALRGINVEVHKGQIVSIIGANGAGKTTLLRTISGLAKSKTGAVEFEGAPLPRKPSKIVGAGVVHVPEGRKCFSGLSIRDNLLVGGYLFKGADLEKDLQEQYKRFPILEKRKDQFAGTLSGGEQQMLAVARGLMSRPKILLLDEPSMGPCAHHREPDLRFDPRNSRFRHYGAAGRAERPQGAGHLRLRLCAGKRQDQPVRLRRGAAEVRCRAQGVSGRLRYGIHTGF